MIGDKNLSFIFIVRLKGNQYKSLRILKYSNRGQIDKVGRHNCSVGFADGLVICGGLKMKNKRKSPSGSLVLKFVLCFMSQ